MYTCIQSEPGSSCVCAVCYRLMSVHTHVRLTHKASLPTKYAHTHTSLNAKEPTHNHTLHIHTHTHTHTHTLTDLYMHTTTNLLCTWSRRLLRVSARLSIRIGWSSIRSGWSSIRSTPRWTIALLRWLTAWRNCTNKHKTNIPHIVQWSSRNMPLTV